MKAFQFIALIVVTFAAVLPFGAAAETTDFTELCRLFKDNTILGMPGTCDKYIQCASNGEGQVYSCGGGTIFDVEKQKCIASSKGCALDNPCAGKSEVWVTDPTSCSGFFYCLNGEAFKGDCGNNLHFDEAKQMCIHPTPTSCVDVPNICELVSKAKFRYEADCSYYYECASKKLSRKQCSKQYFDVESQSCKNKAEVACNAHPYPSEVCGKVGKLKKNVFVADQATCRGYFYCADLGVVPDLEPMWGQCPEGKFFDEKAQACLNPVDVKCTYNRCDGRGNLMVSSSENNCHNYLICENGFVKEEKTCFRDYFFDELYQACVPYIIYYNCCDIPE